MPAIARAPAGCSATRAEKCGKLCWELPLGERRLRAALMPPSATHRRKGGVRPARSAACAPRAQARECAAFFHRDESIFDKNVARAAQEARHPPALARLWPPLCSSRTPAVAPPVRRDGASNVVALTRGERTCRAAAALGVRHLPSGAAAGHKGAGRRSGCACCARHGSGQVARLPGQRKGQPECKRAICRPAKALRVLVRSRNSHVLASVMTF